MEEIEVGEYVRTNTGLILKYDDKNEKAFIDNFIDCQNIMEEKIVNHNKIISEIVEVGDYVNGYRVVAIMEDIETGEIHLEMTSDYTNEIIGDCTIYNSDIKSIVTKEQFKSVEYEVK